jgi:predicted HD phosphohydrolase
MSLRIKPGSAAGAPRAPLAKPHWRYVEKGAIDAFTAEDWRAFSPQRDEYYAENRAAHALRMLRTLEHDASFGYQTNIFTHCLQSATMCRNAGLDDETVAVAALHDIGFTTCMEMHGQFAAALLGAFVSEKHYWMLRHHALFMRSNFDGDPGYAGDTHAREKYRGHPHFEWTATFVDKFDQNAVGDAYETLPLAAFEPQIRALFARAPKPVPIEE